MFSSVLGSRYCGGRRRWCLRGLIYINGCGEVVIVGRCWVLGALGGIYSCMSWPFCDGMDGFVVN